MWALTTLLIAAVLQSSVGVKYGNWTLCFGGTECGTGTQTRVVTMGGIRPVNEKRNCSMPCSKVSKDENEVHDDKEMPTTSPPEEETSPDSLIVAFQDLSSCPAELIEVPYTECNVTCGYGYEQVIMISSTTRLACGDRSRSCFRNCSQQDQPIKYELLEPCSAVCNITSEPGDVVYGTQRYMKFCENVPCGLRTEECSILCIDSDDWWGECSGGCGAPGTQSRVLDGVVLKSRPCEGEPCDTFDTDKQFHYYTQTGINWGGCNVECGPGFQKRDCYNCSLTYDLQPCFNYCPLSESQHIQWTAWSECSISCGTGITSRLQINCRVPDCKIESKICQGICKSHYTNPAITIHKIETVGEEIKTVAEGDMISVPCYVIFNTDDTLDNEINVPLQIRWFSLGKEGLDFKEYINNLNVDDKTRLKFNLLIIPEVSRENIGTYMCTVKHKHVTYTRMFSLNVLHFLRSPDPPIQTLNLGAGTRLICEIGGIRPAWQVEEYIREQDHHATPQKPGQHHDKNNVRVSWRRNGAHLYTMLHVQPPFLSTLVLYNVDKDDEGEYSCKVRYNNVTLVSDAVKIDVSDTQLALDKRGENRTENKNHNTWSEWSKCSSFCGNGFKLRGYLANISTEYQISGCPLNYNKCTSHRFDTFHRQIKGAGYHTVTVDYTVTGLLQVFGMWGNWGQCYFGVRNRTRGCFSNTCEVTSLVETQNCEETLNNRENTDNWGRYSRCSSTCGFGVTVRHLHCEDCRTIEVTSCLESFCSTSTLETIRNTTIYTSLYGIEIYNEWSSWSKCDCDTQSRYRQCLSTCNNQSCDNTACTQVMKEERECKSWGSCETDKVSEACIDGVCPIYKVYSEWGSWSSCINDVSYKYRERKCLQRDGCFEDMLTEVEMCPSKKDSELGQWVNGGQCEVTAGCGQGEQMRVRECYLDDTCPAGSLEYKECDISMFFECTDIFMIVSCHVECVADVTNIVADHDVEGVGEWITYGRCVAESGNCGHGRQLLIKQCYSQGVCSLSDLGCESVEEALKCENVYKQQECDVECETTIWSEINEYCNEFNCTLPITLSTRYLQLEYKSSKSFVAAVDFWAVEEKIGYVAWSLTGLYIEGCYFIKFPTEVTESVDKEVWILYVTDTFLALVIKSKFSFVYNLDSSACADKFRASNVKRVGFKNLRGVKARYSVLHKGDVGEWVNVGTCGTHQTCGTGFQIQVRKCFIDGDCPEVPYILADCDVDNFVECSGYFRVLECTITCSVDEQQISKTGPEGTLTPYGKCVMNNAGKCGDGVKVYLYSCYLDNTCPESHLTSDVVSHDLCTIDNYFQCSHTFNTFPCHVKCPMVEEEKEGIWEKVGKCDSLGAPKCGPYAGSQLEMRSCIKTKSCPRSRIRVDNCTDPWHCSQFYRTVQCEIECKDEELGDWEDMYTCVVNNEQHCGKGYLAQVRSCYKTHTCPAWSARSEDCNGDIMECGSHLFRTTDCHVPCADVKEFEDVGGCLMDDICGAGQQIQVRKCYKDNTCSHYNCTSVLSCPDVFRTKPCMVPCGEASQNNTLSGGSNELGNLVPFGGCITEEGVKCGAGEMVQIYECYFSHTCPPAYYKSRHDCQNFFECTDLFTLEPCHVSCEEELVLGDWVDHGKCQRQGPGFCGPESGSQLQVRECMEKKSCPPFDLETIEYCKDDIWSCNEYFRIIPCSVACESQDVAMLGEWKDIYHCIVEKSDCGFGTKPQMRECMEHRTCPTWSMESVSCFDHFNCSTLFRQVKCVVDCPEVDIVKKDTTTLRQYDTRSAKHMATDTPVKDISATMKHDSVEDMINRGLDGENTNVKLAKETADSLHTKDSIITPVPVISEVPRRTKEHHDLKVPDKTRKPNSTRKPTNTQKPDTTSAPINNIPDIKYKEYGGKITKRQIDKLRPRSCDQIVQTIDNDVLSGPQVLFAQNGISFTTMCLMERYEGMPQGWTLLASFVNSDNKVSWGGRQYNSWVNDQTFGNWETSILSDFKSMAWNEVYGSELLVEDRYGTIRFNLRKNITIAGLLNSTSGCGKSPIVGPGYNVDSTSSMWAEGGVLILYPELQPGYGCNNFTSSGVEGPVLGFGGTKCGLMGAGMGHSYFNYLDWHMSLNPDTTCNSVRCDQTPCTGPWQGSYVLPTSTSPSYKPGDHDLSTWGRLYIR